MTAEKFQLSDLLRDSNYSLNQFSKKHYVADEVLPKLFGPSRHYVDLGSIQRTLEAEAIHYEPTTIKRYLQDWQNEGRIHDAGRGWYTDLPEMWTVDPKVEPIRSLSKVLLEQFPMLDYTMWSTRELAPFFQHLPSRHATFLMVDRDAFEPVVQSLRDQDFRVVVHPLGDIAKAFTLDAPDTVVLRPRLSSDTVAPRSPIEHALVDLYYEIQKLALFDGEEFQHVVRNLGSSVRLKITAMKRYAERRKIDPDQILGSVI